MLRFHLGLPEVDSSEMIIESSDIWERANRSSAIEDDIAQLVVIDIP
jgi:hypothetical protein